MTMHPKSSRLNGIDTLKREINKVHLRCRETQ